MAEKEKEFWESVHTLTNRLHKNDWVAIIKSDMPEFYQLAKAHFEKPNCVKRKTMPFKKKSMQEVPEEVQEMLRENGCYFCDTCGGMVQVFEVEDDFFATSINLDIDCCSEPDYYKYGACFWIENGKEK